MTSETRAGDTTMRETARLMRLATYASVGTAVSLIVIKLVAWVLTDSISLLSTLIDSILDAAASLISLLAVRQALTRPTGSTASGTARRSRWPRSARRPSSPAPRSS